MRYIGKLYLLAFVLDLGLDVIDRVLIPLELLLDYIVLAIAPGLTHLVK